ncbi:helix-turn-helix transcriptional regulator [Paucisalibacillus sp. EB02]|uniref:helix-turn-helix domain-containing protein n=1 Tax=Paucisalibacillus sp. EB02 TaxID=1347087 RepID=UPI0004B050FB|nr:helix-turn-helix transcriptional regulator [Paucisalibacillus sp. EB02]
MNHIGSQIRYHRIKQGLTQSELANGIISFSYLSKIENGNASPDPEVIGLICNKLDISPKELSYFKKNIMACKEWFKSLLLGDKGKSTELFRENINSNKFTDEKMINLIEINKLRYYVLTKQNYKATRQIKVLARKNKAFSNLEQYYWLKFSGNYYFSKGSYHKAFDLFKRAEELISKDLYFREEEENDLYYLIGLAASKVRQVHISLKYVSKALQYYQSQYNLLKCAHCHILLGISYRRINDLERAKQNYEIAIQIGDSLANTYLVSLSNQNIGALYSSIGDSQKAIEYFKKNYETLLGKDNVKLLTPIASLMKECYKIGDRKEASYWLQQGLILTRTLDEKKSILVLDFKVYEQLLTYKYSPRLEFIILKEVFPLLEKNKLEYQKHIYSIILADYYYRMRRYKSAADYYTRANQTLKEIYHD